METIAAGAGERQVIEGATYTARLPRQQAIGSGASPEAAALFRRLRRLRRWLRRRDLRPGERSSLIADYAAAVAEMATLPKPVLATAVAEGDD